MEEYLTPENFMTDFVENFPNQFKGWENNYFLPPSLKAIPSPTTNNQILTEEDIANSPNLQNLGAEAGDQIINGVLHDANGNPK